MCLVQGWVVLSESLFFLTFFTLKVSGATSYLNMEEILGEAWFKFYFQAMPWLSKSCGSQRHAAHNTLQTCLWPHNFTVMSTKIKGYCPEYSTCKFWINWKDCPFSHSGDSSRELEPTKISRYLFQCFVCEDLMHKNLGKVFNSSYIFFCETQQPNYCRANSREILSL